MDIFYLSTACNQNFFDEISKICKVNNKPSISNIRFDNNVLNAINKEHTVRALSYIIMPSYPRCNKFFLKCKYDFIDNFKLKYSSLINITIIKQLIFIITTFIEIIKWSKNCKDEKIILLSMPTDIFILPSFLAKVFLKVKVICIVGDLQEFSIKYRKNIFIAKRILNKISVFFNRYLISNIDGYIFLTKYMDKKINFNRKPFIIIEGLIEKELVNTKNYSKSTDNFKIMYAGTLNEKYGIVRLIQIFEGINDENIQLYIFGSGEYELELIKICEKNKNIKFFGQVSHQVIIEYERQVNLLINVRPSNEEFIKYSFPSKTIEYMASGTPIITTNLKSFPEEYNKYLIFFDEEDLNSMINKLKEVINWDKDKLNNLGKQAKEFILKEKIIEKQGEKIINFLNSF